MSNDRFRWLEAVVIMFALSVAFLSITTTLGIYPKRSMLSIGVGATLLFASAIEWILTPRLLIKYLGAKEVGYVRRGMVIIVGMAAALPSLLLALKFIGY
jgi:hypothetical protein